MKILILGAGGGMSLTTILDLIRTSAASKIIISDVNEEKVKGRAAILKDERIIPILLDIKDLNSSAKIMASVDVVINEAHYELNIHAMRAAMKAGVPLIDLGGLYTMTNRQMDMHDEVEKSGILVIPGIGSDPGTSNILCRHGANKLDKVDEIHIRYGSNWSGLTFTFAVGTILEEATRNAVVYEDFRLKEIPALSRTEDTVFRKPIGVQKTFSILHSELATIPKFIDGVRTVTYHDSWDPKVMDKLKNLNELGLLSDKRIKLGSIEGTVREITTQILTTITLDEKATEGWDELKVSVKGEEGGQETTYVFEVLSKGDPKNGITPLSYLTGTPPSIAAQMIVRGEIKGKGVLPPEKCIDPEKYLRELVKRPIDFLETKIQTRQNKRE
jgi:lysine 6-dehydrogenase